MSIPAYASENDGLEVSTSDSDALIIGIAATVAPFFVPSFTIDASYVLIEYTLTNIDNSAHKNEFSGTVYTCIEKGHNFNKQYKVGKYYPLSAWKTTNFAITVYSYMFGYEFWSVYSWD